MSRPPLSLDELLLSFHQIYWATVAIERRIEKLGPTAKPALAEVREFQRIVKLYRDSLEETARMKGAGAIVRD